MDATLKQAIRYIRDWIGIDLPDYRVPLLHAELQRIGYGDAAVGLTRLVKNEDSIREEFIPILTISETYFFRHRGHFDALKKFAIKQRDLGMPCKVLAAGCSTGEEAWSAAAVLASVYKDSGLSYEVHGWDLDSRRIRYANRGYYGVCAARLGFYEWGEWFRERHDIWQPTEALRTRTQFEVKNLLHAFTTTDTQYDAILFRNVSTYWTKDCTRSVLDNLQESLAEGGLMMLRPVDPEMLNQKDCAIEDVLGSTVLKRVEEEPAPEITYLREATRSKTDAEDATTVMGRVYEISATIVHPAKRVVAEPVPSYSPIPNGTTDDDERILHIVQKLAIDGRYEEAMELLRQHPTSTSLNATLWEGILLLNHNEAEEAINKFLKCLIWDPENPEIRQWLAVSYTAVGRDADAKREYDNAWDLQSHKSTMLAAVT